ncbi:MAG: urease accessory UreF family protein [Paracoccaceae bacterium]
MTEALQKLHAWLSPGYPVGAFAYSHGLEWAIGEGLVRDAASLEGWIGDCLAFGGGRNDAIFAAAAYRAPESDEPAELAAAFAASAERLLETEAQGAAFAATTAAAWGPDLAAAPYPVAFGRFARAHEAPLIEALTLFLQAFASNLVSAGVRLIPLGQTEGQRIVAGLAPQCAALAAEAARAGLDDLGGAALLSDIAAMAHETQHVRLFRT